ncbi:endonuclease [Anaerobacillus alkalidiazotrophicus]|uniref:Endonuclease n=1 Tax=Anaerobacillus alkalidiazotrophicus TaxID=472963 RepID=A0A1S2M069_9BACI|nr:endonuclease/exonuclease/phosphatase family protein [Anaerobacillus alkalidiazotrophicus]OIJ18091.1 endonuclease [Anaerobacillus alkalidiazotrophicus]OIJ19570.1 endonuclease [Anaerobacillus alkalidiazotrophicus]
MKLLTLNCHAWQEEEQLEKIKTLAKTIKENSYDVIALQEVSQSVDEEQLDRNVKKDNYMIVLLDELKKLGVEEYNYFWDFSHFAYEVYEEGLAILTKHKIEKEYSFFVSQSENTKYHKTRKIVGAKITYNNEPISFYSCHLGWWGDEEEPLKKQLDLLCSHVIKSEKVFLLGDFNSDASVEDEGYDYMLANGYYDTFDLAKEKDSGKTVIGKIAGWDKNKRDLRIDYIFSNFQCNVEKSNVIFNHKNKPIISDHYGVEVELSL